MTYPLKRIAQVERDLIVEEGFVPLDKALPLSGLAGAQFHGCLARQKQDRIDVHAMLAWTGQSGEDLAMRTAILRKALEEAAAFFSGRVVATLFLVADSEPEVDLIDQALKSVHAGHFLEKIQINVAGVNARTGQLRFAGRMKPYPDLDWFEEHFLSGGRHEPERVSETLKLLDEEEAHSRRFLSKTAAAPWATYVLIGMSSFMFVATFSMANTLLKSDNAQPLAMLAMGANQGSLVFGRHQFWRLIASLFIHADLIHLLMNMVALYSLGSLVERFTGPARMLFIYFCAGIFGNALSAWQHADIPSVGASGAILGLAGAILALRFRRPEGFPRLLAERLYGSLLWPVVFIFVIGLSLSLFNSRVMFDNWGHLGGLSAGFSLIFAWPALIRPTGSRDS